MNHKILKSTIILGIIIFINIIFTTVSNAALTVTPSKTTVEPGEQFIITVAVSQNEAADATLSATNATLNTTHVNLMDTYTVNVTCIAGSSEGTINITASGRVASYITETEEEQTASTKITVKAPEQEQPPVEEPQEPETPAEPTKSSNNQLRMLGIRPHDFYNFKPGTTTYYVTVPYDTTQVEVYAEKAESSQTISGTGYKSLDVGTNTLRVVCTAEDGTTKTYTMYVTREEEEVVEETPDEEEPAEEEPTEEEPVEEPEEGLSDENTEASDETVLGITNLNIVGKTENGENAEVELTPAFEENTYEYLLTVPLTVKDLEISVDTENGEAQIEVMGNKNLVEGENSVTVIVKVGEETKVYQITVNKTQETGSALSSDVIMQLAIIAAIATIIIVAIIAIIVMIVRSKRKDKKVERTYSKASTTDIQPTVTENPQESDKKEE